MGVFISRFIKSIVILFIFCGLLIALLPKIASTSWGTQQVVSWINRSIPGKIEIRHLDLHWGKGQVLEGLLLKDPEEQSILGVEKFSTEATLWQLLSRSTHLGFTQLHDLNAAIVTDEKGWTNLQRALGVSPSDDTPPLSPSTIVLSDVDADLHLFVPHHPLSVSIKGLTRQENLNGSFEINLSLNGLQASDWKTLKQGAENYLSIEGSKEATIQARIVNFPVDLIDRMIALKNPHLNGLFHSVLGDRLNLTIAKEPSQKGLAFHLTALAPLMRGDVKGEVVDGIFNLQEPAIFHFNLTPDFVNPFTHYQPELLKPSQLKVIFSNLSLPLAFFNHEAAVDPCLFGFKAELSFPETEIEISPIGKINIRTLQAHLESALCDKKIQFQVMGQAQQGKEPLEIHFDSSLNKPKNFASLLQQFHQSLEASLKISHFPLQLIPSFQEHPEWVEQIGSHADAQLNFFPKGKEGWEMSLSLQTPRLVFPKAQFHIAQDLVLKSPAQMEWNGTTDSLSTLLKSNNFMLDQPCTLQFTLQQFQMPLDNPQFAKTQIETSIPLLQFSKLSPWGTVQIQNLTLNLEGQNSRQFQSTINGELALLSQDGTVSPLLQTPLQFSQTSHWKVEQEGKAGISFAQLLLNNSIGNLRMEGRLSSPDVFELTQPAQIQYMLTPAAFQTLSHFLSKEWPKLLEDAHLDLSINQTSFNLKSLNLHSLLIQGVLAIDHLALQDAAGTFTPVLENISLPWEIDGPGNRFFADLKGFAYPQKKGKASQIAAHFQFWPAKDEPTQTKAEIHLNLAGMPTSIFSIFLAEQDLSPVFGSTMDIHVKAFFDPTHEKSGYCDLTLDSAQLHLSGCFKLQDAATICNPDKPPTIRFTVSPESYLYLKKYFSIQDHWELASPFTLTGSLSQFYFPLKNVSLSNLGHFDFQFSTTEIRWQDSAIEPVRVEGKIDSQNVMEDILFSIGVRSSVPLFSLEGALTHVFDTQYKLQNWKEMGLEAKATAQQLTPALLQRLFLIQSDQALKLRAFFGESLEAKADCRLQNLTGPIRASVKGSQGEINLDGQLKQGVLTLNRPLTGTTTMTPLLSQACLSKDSPFLHEVIGAENPITFSIDPTQFSCPLTPYKLDQLKIGRGVLELGKIRFRNEGELDSLLNFIHSFSDPYLMIWFTPLHFQLDQGILNLKRMDMLISNTYSLACWGNIRLNQHQADLNIGLTAQTLQTAFGIKGLDPSTLLQVHVHSMNGKVEIDKKKATARIGALIAQTKGGSAGKLLGNLLDFAASGLDEIAPPLPTTQPFPWEEKFPSLSPIEKEQAHIKSRSPASPQTEEGPERKKKKKEKHKEREPDHLIKSLQEGANQILDMIKM